MSGALQPWHIIIVALVFVLLYGSRRLPGAARSLGQSLRILKTELAHQPVLPAPHDAAHGHLDASPPSSGTDPRGDQPANP